MVTILTNQTVYQCDHCNKRLLSKQGAKLHEEKYCRKSPIVLEKGRKIIENCEHHWLTSWTPIPGEEHLKEPDYDFCAHCGVKSYEYADGTTNSPEALHRALRYYEEDNLFQINSTPITYGGDEELPF